MTEAERGVVGAATELGNKLIGSLPSQFLMLCVLNTIFIIGLLWFLDREQTGRIALETHEAEGRERVLMPLLGACIKQGMNPEK